MLPIEHQVASVELQAAVEVEHLAGDEPAERVCQEQHAVRKLLQFAKPADRDLLAQLGLALGADLFGQHLGLDEGRRQCVARDAKSGIFARRA